MNKDQAYYARKYRQQGRKYRSIWNGLWFDPDLNRYVDYGRGGGNRSSYYKAKCNREFRRNKSIEHFSQKALYKKYTEYWYEMY